MGRYPSRKQVAMTLRDQNNSVALSSYSERIASLLRDAKTRDEGVSKRDLETKVTPFVEDKIKALRRARFVIGQEADKDGQTTYYLVHEPDVGRRADTAGVATGLASPAGTTHPVSASSSTGTPERLFEPRTLGLAA